MLMISLLAAMPDLRRQALARHVPHGPGCRECGPRTAWPCEVAAIAARAEELAGGHPHSATAAAPWTTTVPAPAPAWTTTVPAPAAGPPTDVAPAGVVPPIGRSRHDLSYLPEPRPGEPGPGASRREPLVPAWAQRPRQVPVRRQRPDALPSR